MTNQNQKQDPLSGSSLDPLWVLPVRVIGGASPPRSPPQDPVRLSLFQGPLNPFNGFHFPPQRWNFDQNMQTKVQNFPKDAL